MAKKKKGPFKELQSAATGMAGLGLTTAVGASIAAKAPVGSANLTGGFNTLAGFAPIAVTAVGGKAVLKTLPKLKKKKF